jgi:hypothetical protein
MTLKSRPSRHQPLNFGNRSFSRVAVYRRFGVLVCKRCIDGYQAYIPEVALGKSLVTMIVVLLLFLFMRSAMGDNQ